MLHPDRPFGGKSLSPKAHLGRADRDSAMFQYSGFSYESGIDQVLQFDASIEIFGETKTVKVFIDTPFVKDLSTLMVVKQSLLDGSYRESSIRRTYEYPLTLELQ